jgi:hypothetical protein
MNNNPNDYVGCRNCGECGTHDFKGPCPFCR